MTLLQSPFAPAVLFTLQPTVMLLPRVQDVSKTREDSGGLESTPGIHGVDVSCGGSSACHQKSRAITS
jgi:hypothetical protein